MERRWNIDADEFGENEQETQGNIFENESKSVEIVVYREVSIETENSADSIETPLIIHIIWIPRSGDLPKQSNQLKTEKKKKRANHELFKIRRQPGKANVINDHWLLW